MPAKTIRRKPSPVSASKTRNARRGLPSMNTVLTPKMIMRMSLMQLLTPLRTTLGRKK